MGILGALKLRLTHRLFGAPVVGVDGHLLGMLTGREGFNAGVDAARDGASAGLVPARGDSPRVRLDRGREPVVLSDGRPAVRVR